jgi:predicted component of type VI protein secretion system
MRVQLVECTSLLSEVLECFEARLKQVEVVMTSALISEICRRDSQSAVKRRLC